MAIAPTNAPSRRSLQDIRWQVWVKRLIFGVAAIALWEVLYRLKLWPPYIFPSPLDVGGALVSGMQDGSIAIAIEGSFRRLLTGYVIALISGLTLGVLMAQVRWVKETLGLLVMGLQTLPSVCWLPLALLWFGLNEKAILFVVVMGAVLSIAQATEDGIRNTSPLYLRAGRNLGARGWRLYVYIVLPAALPAIVTGMKLGWSFAWRSLMAGELLYTLPSLGHLLMMGRELNDMAQVIAVMVIIITLGLFSDQIVFTFLERKVRERWGLA